MGRACSTKGGEEECVQGFGGKAGRKETTGKTRCEDFRMDLREIGWGGMDWIDLAHDRDQ
jgi:hypothetical protein